MERRARVFVETSTLQYSVRSRRLMRPQPGAPALVHLGEEDPTASIEGEEMRVEVDLLPRVAELAKAGVIQLLCHVEARFEYLGVHKLGDGPSILLEAPVIDVKSPIDYSRIVVGPSFGDARTLRINFLKGLKHSRFLEIWRATGV